MNPCIPLTPERAINGVRVMLAREDSHLRAHHGVVAGREIGIIAGLTGDADARRVAVDWGTGVRVPSHFGDLVELTTPHPYPGFWVVVEGGDSVGKTTQMEILQRRLGGTGSNVIRTREPGGTELGEQLRTIVLHGGHVDPRAEALLYAAIRAHHVATKVGPALECGAVVLQDRFADSSIVYQGIVRGLGVERIRDLSGWSAGGVRPDLVIVLDREPMAIERERDRVEIETADAAARIRAGFLHLAEEDPDGHVVIDAARTVEEVAADIWREVSSRMPGNTSDVAVA